MEWAEFQKQESKINKLIGFVEQARNSTFSIELAVTSSHKELAVPSDSLQEV